MSMAAQDKRFYESLVLCGRKSTAVKGSITASTSTKKKEKEKKRKPWYFLCGSDDDWDELVDLGTSSVKHGYGYCQLRRLRLYKAGITMAFMDDLSIEEKKILGLIGPAPSDNPVISMTVARGRPKGPMRVKVVFRNDLSPEEEEMLKSMWRPQYDPSIILFKAAATGFYYGLEFAITNLREYMYSEKQNYFTIDQVKKMTKQLLQWVGLLHHKGVMHMNLNPRNIPVTRGGDLQIWNFQRAARFGTGDQEYPEYPDWDWYRAPELLQRRRRRYSSEVDMWSVGCIMAELVLHRRLFSRVGRRKDALLSCERRKQEHLNEIDRVLNETTSSTMSVLRDALKEDGFHLLKGLLTYDPTKRITAESALNHVWFHDNN